MSACIGTMPARRCGKTCELASRSNENLCELRSVAGPEAVARAREIPPRPRTPSASLTGGRAVNDCAGLLTRFWYLYAFRRPSFYVSLDFPSTPLNSPVARSLPHPLISALARSPSRFSYSRRRDKYGRGDKVFAVQRYSQTRPSSLT